MQLSTLLPILALLATPIAAREPIEARRNLARHKQHVRAVDQTAQNMARRDALAASKPKAKSRKVKRGANGCRARGSTFTANATSIAAASTSAAASSAVVSVAISSAAAAASASSAAASPAPSSDAPAPSSEAAAPSPAAESSAAPAQTSAASSGGGYTGGGGLTPNGIKAGASGVDTLDLFGSHIGWFWNYGSTRDAPDSSLIFVPTVWGDGHTGDQDWGRLNAFEQINWNPQYVQGFYEPDCSPPMSSAIDPYTAAPLWNSVIAPWKAKGALLVSPGMCKQADEDWLTPFKNQIGDNNMWDITSVHINKLDMDGAKKVLDHYWNTYGKPMWVTEFACVDDANGFTPSEDQGQINSYINNIVDLLENDSRVMAYSMSEGMGLGNTWPPYRDGALTESGQTYLNAISKYH